MADDGRTSTVAAPTPPTPLEPERGPPAGGAALSLDSAAETGAEPVAAATT